MNYLPPADFSLPPDGGAIAGAIRQQTSKPIRLICLDTTRARAGVCEMEVKKRASFIWISIYWPTAFGGADYAECPPPARQRRSIASFSPAA